MERDNVNSPSPKAHGRFSFTSRSSVQKIVGPEMSLGISRQNTRRKIKHWMDNQHLTRWQGLSSTKRQAQELILDPSPTAETRLLSSNKTQSTVITDLTGHNTLRRHLHLMELTNSPLCRRHGAEDETSAHILCECEAVAALRHVYLGH